MPWQVPITVDGLEYPVTFNTEGEPSQQDYDDAVQQILSQKTSPAPKSEEESPGYLSQLGSALGLGYRQMKSGVGATFNALTGDTADVAAEMAEMSKLQREQQAAQTPEDVEFMRSLEEAEQGFEKASGPLESIGALAQYPAAVLAQPGAAFKTAVQSAPNALISGATSLAGYGLGGLVGGAANIETGPGAILTGIAGAMAGGALSNTLMEAGPAIFDVLNERTQGAASNMTADEISAYLQQNPDIVEEGMKTGAIRGSVIGAVESLGVKGSGRLLTIPERAAARAVQKELVAAGVDVASKEAVDQALLDPALRATTKAAAEAAKGQFSSAGNMARLAGASAIDTGAAGAGELAAQAVAGQEISTKEAFMEMLGDTALSLPMSVATKAVEGAQYMLNPALIADVGKVSVQNLADTGNGASAAAQDEFNKTVAEILQTPEPTVQPEQAAETPTPEVNLNEPTVPEEPELQPENIPNLEGDPFAEAKGPVSEEVIQPTPQALNAPDQITDQESLRQELQDRTGGRETEETGVSDSLRSQEEVEEEVITPKGTPTLATEGTPTSRDVGTERDSTKPEQMTPEEYHVYNSEGIIADYESGGKAPRGFASYEVIRPMSEDEKQDLRSDRAFSARNHRSSLERAIETKDSVSAASVDTYGITLPEGYVKQGDLYVFQPGATGATPVQAAPSAAQVVKATAPGPVFQIKRSRDFLTSGNYDVTTPDGVKRIFRDPETGAWMDADEKAPVYSPLPFKLLGYSKKEALDSLRKEYQTTTVATNETAPPSAKGEAVASAVEQPVEGSIPTVPTRETPKTDLSTPESKAADQEEQDAQKRQKKQNESIRKSLDSIIDKRNTNIVQGTVTAADAEAARTELNNSGEIPNAFLTRIYESPKEFLADKSNERYFPSSYADLQANSNIEGLFENGQTLIFVKNIGVSDLDRDIAKNLGISPELAAARRVIAHENGHRGVSLFTLNERREFIRHIRQMYSDEEIQNLVRLYTKYADWRTNPDSRDAALEELFMKKFDSLKKIPTGGVWDDIVQFLKKVWRRLTGSKDEPTLNDMKDVIRLLRNAMQRAEVPPSSFTLNNGGEVRLREANPEFASSETAAFNAGSEAARDTIYNKRDMDVREAIRRAYQPTENSVAVPLDELFAKAKDQIPDLSEDEFSNVLQDLYEDSGAVLQEGESAFGVFTPEGRRAGFAVIMPRQAMASRISEEDAEKASKTFREDLVEAGKGRVDTAAFEGRELKGTEAPEHNVNAPELYKKAAKDLIQKLEDQKHDIIDIAKSLQDPKFQISVGMQVGDDVSSDMISSVRVYIGLALQNRIENEAKKARTPLRKRQLEVALRNANVYYQAVTGIGKNLNLVGQGQKDPEFKWMILTNNAQNKKAEVAKERLDALTGGTNQITNTINESENEASIEAVKALEAEDAGAIEDDQDAIDLAEGEATLDTRGKNLWEKFKDLIRKRGIAMRALDALRAGNRAKASISSEERNAISQMSEEELIKLIADIDNEMASVFDEFTKTPATRKKREKMVATAKKRAEQGKNIEAFLEGPNARQNLLREMNKARPASQVPLERAMPWKDILSQKSQNVEEYRQRIFDAISSLPAMENITEDQKQRLAELYAEAFEEKREEILKRILEREEARLFNSNAITKKAAKALQESRNKIIELVNLGGFNNDDLVKILGERFGISTSFTEEQKAKITDLAEKLQDEDMNQAKRNKLAMQFVIELAGATDASVTEILSNWWTSSVLFGPQTIFSIGAAFLNGGYNIVTIGMSRAIAKIAQGDFVGAIDESILILKGIARYLGAFKQSGSRAWNYLWSGEIEQLDASANDILGQIKSFDDLQNLKKHRLLAENLAKDPRKLRRYIGKYLRFINRLLTALDGFNVMVTKAGTTSLALRMSGLDTKKIIEAEKMLNLKSYKQDIIDKEFGGVAPTNSLEKSRLDSYAEAAMYRALDKFGVKMENADYLASESAMTMNPTGFGGFIYKKITGIDKEARKSADEYLEKVKKNWMSQKDLDSFRDLSLAYIRQFFVYQAANLAGYKFLRYASNKFNQGISYIPLIGLARKFEARGDEIKGKDAFIETIHRNQMITFLIALVGSAVIKAITEEPDDEKRGWLWNGGWENLTPDQKKQRLALGQKEYTIGFKYNGRWYYFNYLNWPINQPLSAIGSISDQIRFSPQQWGEKGALSKITSGMVSGLKSTLDIPALSQLGEIFVNRISSKDPTEQTLDRTSRILSGWVGGFVPRILKDIDFYTQPELRKYEGLWEKTASHIPIYRRYVGDEYYDILAYPIKRNVIPGSREFMAGATETEKKILGALNARNIWLTPANAEYRMIGKGRNRRRLTQEEADAYSLETGKGYRQMLLRYGQRALQMPTERARAFLSDKADEVRDRALKKVYRGYLR